MKNQKMYEADDKMISIIRDNYNILQSLGSFGINLGFGDKKVDTYTFLAVVNFTINGYKEYDNADRLSLPTLLHYLKASHAYYIDFQLPFIRRELVDALDETDNLARLILKLYDDYAHSITNHMKYEEKMVFPYVQALIDGNANANFDIETFSKHHVQVDMKLKELKSIIIKYLPSDGLHNNQLSDTLEHDQPDAEQRRAVERPREGCNHCAGSGNVEQGDSRPSLYLCEYGDYPSPKHRPKASDSFSCGPDDLCHRKRPG